MTPSESRAESQESQMSHDETTQRALLSDFQTTFLLEAGAGTGKTQMLLQRLLALLRTRRSSLDRIAVITFTDKAAMELRTRLRAEIESVLESPLAEAERDALQTALRQLDRAVVTTVHAFCAALLRERAFEARLDTHFVVLDQAHANALQDDVWNSWLATEFNLDSPDSQNSPLLRQAFRAGLTISHLASLRDFLSENRDCLAWLPAPVSSPLPTFCHSVQDAVVRLAALRGCCQDTTDKVWEQIALLIDAVPTSYEEEAWERFLIHGLRLQPRKGKKENWQPASALQEARTLLIQVKESYLQARSAWFHNLTVGLAHWMEGYLQAYQAKKRQRCSLDFLDLLVILRDVLKQNHELRRYFQRKFDFLFVDEVQDTDPLQAEIAFFLAEDQPQAEHWTQVTLRPGKLFLVGDPQQSIYRFRRADIDVYQVVRSIIERQGSVLSLSLNFRMRAALVDWMNETFARILQDRQDLKNPHDEGEDQPSYQPLLAANGEEADRKDPVVFLLQYPRHRPNGQYKRETQQGAEAQCVARFVRHIVEQQPLMTQTGQALRYGDIALLFRTNRSVEIYAAVLREAQIPYRSVHAQQKTPSVEGEEIRACVRMLEHPADTTAFVATLRSSLFGFSDEELAQFICTGGKFDYLRGVVPARLPSADRFHAAFALLRILHGQQCTVGIAPLLSEIYARTPALPLLSLHQDGKQRQRALLQLIEAGYERLGSESGSIANLERFLAYSSREQEIGEDPTSQDRQDALHLLTIHKAKGLEFPMVILAEPESQQNRLSRTGLVGRKDPRLDLQIGPRSLTCTTQGWQAAEAQERSREAAEERRLWYVAATRAREYVGIPLQAAIREGAANKRGKRDILVEEAQRSSHTVIVDFSDQDIAVASTASVSADEPSADERERPSSIFLSIFGADKPAQPAPAQPAFDVLYSDLAWLTERRRLLAKGRRKGQTQKKKMIRTEISPWKPTDVDRVVKQMAARVRKSGLSGVEGDRFTQKPAYASGLWERIAAAPIWARVRAARRCVTYEVFALRSGEIVLEGTIPLAWLEDEKWIVVYFHEGEMLNAGTGQARVCEKLGPSAWALEQLTPFPVRELVLFFINQQQEIRIAWNTDTRASLQGRLFRV